VYPEAWSRASIFPYTRFHPSLDYYSAADASVERRQTDAMLFAHLNAGIYSWWGRGTDTDVRFWRYLAVARPTPLRWAVYYEPEGYRDPSVDQIRSDLEYIRDLYAYRPAYSASATASSSSSTATRETRAGPSTGGARRTTASARTSS
jgi:hypothetical protein